MCIVVCIGGADVSDKTNKKMSLQILDKVMTEISRQPSRTPMIVRSATGTATRRSRGKSDSATKGAISYTGGAGYGVIESSRKERDHDDDWVIAMQVRPPQTDAERLAIARAMVARWTEESAFRTIHGPDDERDRAAWDAAAALNREIAENLKTLIA